MRATSSAMLRRSSFSRTLPVGPGQLVRPLAHAVLELLIGTLQRSLRVLALRNLPLQRQVQVGERAGFSKRVDEHTDFGPQDRRR